MRDSLSNDSDFGYSVAKGIMRRGYIPGNVFGRIERDYGTEITDKVSVLKENPSALKRLSAKMSRNKNDYKVADIIFKDPEKGADIDENWVVEVYGKENYDGVVKLVNSMADRFGVKAEIYMKSEDQKLHKTQRLMF